MSILRLALNSIAGLSTDIYSAVTSVTEAIRTEEYLTPIRHTQQMKNLGKIISIFGGVKNLYASIDNEPFMRLMIEDIGHGPRGYQAVSVAHYFEQAGDLCQAPEMAFELVPQSDEFAYEPYLFQQAIPPIYQEVFESGSEDARLKRQLTSFARQ